MYFHRPKLQGGVPKLTNMRYAQLPDDKSGNLEWSTIFGLCRLVPSERMQGWTRMKIRRQELGVGHPVTHALLVQEVELLTHVFYLLLCYCQSNRYVSEGGVWRSYKRWGKARFISMPIWQPQMQRKEAPGSLDFIYIVRKKLQHFPTLKGRR